MLTAYEAVSLSGFPWTVGVPMRPCVYAGVAFLVRVRVVDVQTRSQLAGFAVVAVLTDVARAVVSHQAASPTAWIVGATGAFAGLWWGRGIAHGRQARAWRMRSGIDDASGNRT